MAEMVSAAHFAAIQDGRFLAVGPVPGPAAVNAMVVARVEHFPTVDDWEAVLSAHLNDGREWGIWRAATEAVRLWGGAVLVAHPDGT